MHAPREELASEPAPFHARAPLCEAKRRSLGGARARETVQASALQKPEFPNPDILTSPVVGIWTSRHLDILTSEMSGI